METRRPTRCARILRPAHQAASGRPFETVSRAVLCLRLSTWIALVEYRRNPMTGFDGQATRCGINLLAFDDARMEDEDHLPLLERALGHASADDSPTGAVHS